MALFVKPSSRAVGHEPLVWLQLLRTARFEQRLNEIMAPNASQTLCHLSQRFCRGPLAWDAISNFNCLFH